MASQPLGGVWGVQKHGTKRPPDLEGPINGRASFGDDLWGRGEKHLSVQPGLWTMFCGVVGA